MPALPMLRMVGSAMPPCSRAMNFTCPAIWSSEARQAGFTGARGVSCGGRAAIHGTAGPVTACGLGLEPESQPAASASSTESAIGAFARTRP